MKIGIMGTHCTGKTTLSRVLADSLGEMLPGRTVLRVGEIARSCPLPINEKMTPESQAWIFHRQMVAEIEAAARADVVVCDRTALDSLAYTDWARYRVLEETLTKRFLDLKDILLPLAIEHFAGYDRVVFLRPKMPLKNDGFRSSDIIFRCMVDAVLERWVKIFALPVIEADIVAFDHAVFMDMVLRQLEVRECIHADRNPSRCSRSSGSPPETTVPLP